MAVDDLNIVEPSVKNGDAFTVLLPNLSILGVSESNHSSHVGTLPSASCLDVTANTKASSCDSSSLSCSAQGKSLIFDVISMVSYFKLMYSLCWNINILLLLYQCYFSMGCPITAEANELNV